jgi:hypothetical protein
VYIALPHLYSTPKVIRIPLDEAADTETDDRLGSIQTLQTPVYLPSTTPFRNPKLLIRTSNSLTQAQAQAQADRARDASQTEPTMQLILSLDTDRSYSLAPDTAFSPSPPLLMTWSIAERSGWRKWDADTDGRCPGLRRGVRNYEMLRGSFVDAEQRFAVCIRSGLDWKKKAIVTCI